MSNKARNKVLDGFIDESMKPLRDALRDLQTQRPRAEIRIIGDEVTSKIRLLSVFEMEVIRDIRALQTKDQITNKEIDTLIDNCVKKAIPVIAAFPKDENNRTIFEIILDTLKKIANCFINFVTWGSTPRFFSLSTDRDTNVRNGVNEMTHSGLQQLKETIQSHLDDVPEAVPSSAAPAMV